MSRKYLITEDEFESIRVEGRDLVATRDNGTPVNFGQVVPDISPEMQQMFDDTVEARDQAEVFSATTVELQDAAIAQVISTPGSETQTQLNASFIGSRTTAEQEVAPVGPDLLEGGSWTLGAGWSGDAATGFTHTPGNDEPLTWTPPFATGTDLYVVDWQYDGNPDHQDKWSGFDLTFGGGDAGIIYQGGASSNQYSRGIRSQTDGSLIITPWEGGVLEGRLHSFAIRRLIGTAPYPPATFRNAIGGRVAEIRFGAESTSVYFGAGSGSSSVSDRRNVGVGMNAMRDNVTGFFNTAVGYTALAANTNGTRNAAFGYQALSANTSGDRNVGVGPFALTRNTTGQRNVAIGVDVLWRNEVGSDNIGIGYLTLTELGANGDNAVENIALGRYAMRQSKLGDRNIAVGVESLYNMQGDGAIAIGARALWTLKGGESVAIGNDALTSHNANAESSAQTAIGTRALKRGTSGSAFIRNTAVGYESGENLMRGSNTSLGFRALQGDAEVSATGAEGSLNTAVGTLAGFQIGTGSQNTILGAESGTGLKSGSGNVLIGHGVEAALGGGAATASDRLNIGNLLRGDFADGTVSIGIPFVASSSSTGITARLDIAEGTADYPSLRLRPGVLATTPVAGAIEFDGTKLYITIGSTRREIALV